jgi:xylulokinase
MHGTVLLDKKDRLLAPAVIWPDQRSLNQVKEITHLVGAEHLIEVTGSPVATGFQAATVCWFQQEQPQIWQRVRRVLLPKDYLRWRLTGEFASDASDGAARSCSMCVPGLVWGLLALKIQARQLPPILFTIAGRLTTDAGRALDLPAGLPVITGAGDTPASLLGAGVINPETLLFTISTGGQLAVPSYQVNVDRSGRMHTFCSALEPTQQQAGWYQMGATLSAGQSLRWLRDNFLGLAGEDAYQRLIDWAIDAPRRKGIDLLPI